MPLRATSTIQGLVVATDGTVHRVHILTPDNPTLNVTEAGLAYRTVVQGAGGAGGANDTTSSWGGGGSAGEFVHRLNVGFALGTHTLTGGLRGSVTLPSRDGQDTNFNGITCRGGGHGGSVGEAGVNGGGGGANPNSAGSTLQKYNADGYGNSGTSASTGTDQSGGTHMRGGGGSGGGSNAGRRVGDQEHIGDGGGMSLMCDISGQTTFAGGGNGSGGNHLGASVLPDLMMNDVLMVLDGVSVSGGHGGAGGYRQDINHSLDGADGGAVVRYSTGQFVLLGVSENPRAGSVTPVRELVNPGQNRNFVVSTVSVPINPWYIKKLTLDNLTNTPTPIAMDATSQWGVSIPRQNIQANWRCIADFARAEQWNVTIQGNGTATVTPSQNVNLTEWVQTEYIYINPDPGSFLMGVWVEGVKQTITPQMQVDGWGTTVNYSFDGAVHEIVASLIRGSLLNVIQEPYSYATPGGISLGGENGRWVRVVIEANDCLHRIGVVTISTPQGVTNITVNGARWESDFFIPPDSAGSYNTITYTVVAI